MAFFKTPDQAMNIFYTAYQFSGLVPAAWRQSLGRHFVNLQNFLKYREWNFIYDIELETSVACNRRCGYCPVAYAPQRKQRFLTVSVLANPYGLARLQRVS
jgi:hypothetical protein